MNTCLVYLIKTVLQSVVCGLFLGLGTVSRFVFLMQQTCKSRIKCPNMAAYLEPVSLTTYLITNMYLETWMTPKTHFDNATTLFLMFIVLISFCFVLRSTCGSWERAERLKIQNMHLLCLSHMNLYWCLYRKWTKLQMSGQRSGFFFPCRSVSAEQN